MVTVVTTAITLQYEAAVLLPKAFKGMSKRVPLQTISV